MNVLHTHWHTPADPTDPDGLLFWLEDGDAPHPPKLRGRPGKTAKGHPFCAEPQEAWAVLRHFGAGARVEQLDVVTLWLAAMPPLCRAAAGIARRFLAAGGVAGRTAGGYQAAAHAAAHPQAVGATQLC